MRLSWRQQWGPIWLAPIVVCSLLTLPGCGQKSQAPAGHSALQSKPPTKLPHVPTPESSRTNLPESAKSDGWFEDVTVETGVRFTNRNGREAGRYLMIESFGGGTAVLDYDLDDCVDLCVTGGGTISEELPLRISGLPLGFFRNEGDWKFTDRALQTRLHEPADYSQGCAVTDYNSDGFPDVLICGYGRTRLYENFGDGTFKEPTTDQALPTHGWGTAAALGDWDGDTFPDLLLARYTDWTPASDVPCYGATHERDLCGPTSYPGATCLFFHNCGDGTFEDWSDRMGLVAAAHGLGVVAADLNLDGWVDFYVSSDALPNHLYLGGPDKKFIETGLEAGVAVGEWGQPEASMGIDVGDYNGDGLPDIFVTNFEKEDHSLYRNLGNGLWMHSTVATGLSAASRLRVGFGTSLCDFDGDHWPDIFVLNGNPIYTTAESPFTQRPQLFQNRDGQRFVEISDRGGSYFHEEHSGRGSAIADFDNDGDFDLVTVLINEPIRLLRNRRIGNRFVRVQLHARNGDRDAVGARVTYESDGRKWTQFVVRGGSYFSQSDSRLIVPISETEDSVNVTVAWPDRGVERFQRLKSGTTHHLVEGKGVPQDELR